MVAAARRFSLHGGPKTAIGGIAPALLAALAVAASSGASEGSKHPPPHVATTGNKSELIERVPIRRGHGDGERVAMRLRPSALEPIEAGDRLRAGAEVQVSTTCIVPGPRCVGRSYTLSPTVTAQIVLSRGHKARSPSIALSERLTVLCKQHRPNRNHHCTLTIPNTVTRVPNPAALPCPPDRCFVNLLLSAHNHKARRGEYVVLGGDRPDGSLEQDKGRLTVIQAHDSVRAPAVFTNAALLHHRLPLTVADSDKRRIVYAMPIVAPLRGEVLAFDVKFVSAISALPFNTFVTSRVILASGPFKTKPTKKAKTSIRFQGQATEANGFDCTLGPSGYANPCITHKTGAIRFRRDVVHEKAGTPATLWLNVIAGAKPLLAERVKSVNKVSLAAQPNGLTVWRYGGP
jgi:hypothetical protein